MTKYIVSFSSHFAIRVGDPCWDQANCNCDVCAHLPWYVHGSRPSKKLTSRKKKERKKVVFALLERHDQVISLWERLIYILMNPFIWFVPILLQPSLTIIRTISVSYQYASIYPHPIYSQSWYIPIERVVRVLMRKSWYVST